MTDLPTLLASVRELLPRVTPRDQLTLNSYDHGGGRLFKDNTATGGGRDLVADFYGDGANRDLYSIAPTLAATLLELAVENERLRAEAEENYNGVAFARDHERARAERAEAALREIAELARRINSSGGYTLEERLDRIAALTHQENDIG